MRQRAFVVVILILVVGFGATWYRSIALRQHLVAPKSFAMATLWPEPKPISVFDLRDHKAESFGLDQLRGQWTLLFFGYTSCPDICPTTMFILRSIVSELEKSGATSPRIVLVSVDPERDDSETLGKYVTHFGKDFLGVSGHEDELESLALQVGAMYERGPSDENGGYDVAHSASIFVVDPQARIYAVFSPPHKATAIAETLVRLWQEYERG